MKGRAAALAAKSAAAAAAAAAAAFAAFAALAAFTTILPGVLLLAAAPAALAAQSGQAQQLGRLFNTPQQRNMLDARREGGTVEAPPPPAPAIEFRPEPLQLSGVVQRSNGQNTIWVNQAPLPDSEGQVLKDRSVSLRLPSGQRIILKPGQSYDETTGTVANAGE